jgi:hypothetical protein
VQRTTKQQSNKIMKQLMNVAITGAVDLCEVPHVVLRTIPIPMINHTFRETIALSEPTQRELEGCPKNKRRSTRGFKHAPNVRNVKVRG